jgi:hypothetical protein
MMATCATDYTVLIKKLFGHFKFVPEVPDYRKWKFCLRIPTQCGNTEHTLPPTPPEITEGGKLRVGKERSWGEGGEGEISYSSIRANPPG